MSFIAVAAGVGIAAGAANAISGWKKKKAAKAANAQARQEMEAAKEKYMNLDTSNPYLNMENTMEDLTVNQQAADFAATKSAQSEANILNNMNKAAGGSGVAALAQALANQQQIGAQKASTSIAEQEAMNQKAERGQASKIQSLEREGEIQSRNLKQKQAGVALDMASMDVSNTAGQMMAADQQMAAGITSMGTSVGNLASGLGMRKKNSSLKMRSPFKGGVLSAGSWDPKYYQEAMTAQNRAQGNTLGALSYIAEDITGGLMQQKEAEKTRIEGYENMLQGNVDKIAEGAGGLGKEYYNIAFDQASGLQEQYMEAVRNNDKKKQAEIKLQLQGLSTSVGTLKEGLNLVSEMQNNEQGKSDLSAGMTEQEKMILATCTDPNNLVYQNGEFVWKNPEYDPNVENSKEFFNQDDFSSSLKEIDRAGMKSYIEYEENFTNAGSDFINGVEGASQFEEDRIKSKNLDFITEDNISSMMHDDYRGTGTQNTFAKQIGGYLEQVNYANLGLDPAQFDRTGEGVVDENDFINEEDKDKLYRAITDRSHPLYDFNTSQAILADYLTMNQKKRFYGNSNPNLTPQVGETMDEFISRGGIMGMHTGPGSNLVYDKDAGFRQRQGASVDDILAGA